MKKILILGSNGFIGKNIFEYLVSFPKNYMINNPNSNELNLLDGEMVHEFLLNNSFDIIINAAISNPKRPSYIENTNELYSDLKMYYNLEKCSELYGKMLYFGSGAEYDKRFPICNVIEDEVGKSIPNSDYGFAKYIIGRNIEKSKNIYNFRIFGLFGKYENWRTTFISGACCKALKNIPITIRQNVIFDYLYIDDFLMAIEWFINNDTKFHTYNVTSGKNIDLITIADIINGFIDNPVPIYVCKEGYANEYTASNERLIKEFKEFKITDIRKSICELLKYYENNINHIDIYPLLYQ